MKTLFALSLLFFLSACSHTLKFRASHFAVPVTGENQWDGYAALVGAAVTKVTVIENIETNPPTRNSVKINEDVDAADLVFANNIGVDAGLTVWKGIDLFLDNSLVGFRYQFLNHGAGPHNWVASLQGAYGQKDNTSSITSGGSTSEAKSKIITSQAGISLGYKLEHVVPYLSYIYESHDASTDVTNNSGSFGPYKDNGIHQYYSVGITSHERGFLYGVEYSRIQIKWDRSEEKPQDSMGLRFGFAW